ncbi:primosomal protein N' [Bifidobacterium castoris]|uniref:Primosome assembly protein PriA n=1 Tax=Bifidobacterium castoris TaxID=2306972 RepID=A0A430F884_9BIFI|nr:primosomal protein N' [Bifidobacterium castoris]RSX48778.1 primosome assembly protein PriA [Bifidobacterium castoris]
MNTSEATQPTFDGMQPRARRPRGKAPRTPAARMPVARVVLDIQATHLGRCFDYLIDERLDAAARPGCLVRVRFGGQRVSGIIWQRVERSDTDPSALRYIERVLSGVVMDGQMRRDVAAIAEAYGGTCANIVRVALPQRIAAVDKQMAQADAALDGAPESDAGGRAVAAQAMYADFARRYEQAQLLADALGAGRFRSFVVDAVAGAAADDLAWMAASALTHGGSAVLVMPTMREVWEVMRALEGAGLRAFAPDGESWDGEVAVFSGSLGPAQRYRSYLAVASGRVRCVVGTRAAMYAPVSGHALFAVLDDGAYQYADGLMPYANARGVCRLRARLHDGVFVAMAYARSVLSQWECEDTTAMPVAVSGPSTAIVPRRDIARAAAPPVRWLNRDELARLADPSIGARVPHTAVRALSAALEHGPVLFSIPSDGISESPVCARCLRQARCLRCTGPLERGGPNAAPRCRWCGAPAVDWHCPHCGGERMRVVRVGAAGTAQELQGLFRGVPMILSSPHQPQGVIEQVADAPAIVIATPGAEPRVRDGAYCAVAILDAWTSLYRQNIDAYVDVLRDWMRAMALCAPRADGGVGLLVGETDPVIAQSLMTWDSRVLARAELAQRREAGLPPFVSAACVWGQRNAVAEALRRIGVVGGGDWAALHIGDDEFPAVLGPVPIAPERTVDSRELEQMRDRVKAVVLVTHARRAELATRLRTAVARHVAAREFGELRFRIDPKDLL